MSLLRLNNLHLAYGDRPLLDGVDLVLNAGDRLCLLGRNGMGKSSLIRLIAGQQAADDGEIWIQPEARIGHLEQELPPKTDLSVYDYIATAHDATGQLLSEYDHLIQDSNHDINRLAELQQQIEAADGWSLQQRIELLLRRLGIPTEKLLSEFSGGWRRRIGLARVLSLEPDILLLDEPTNHLDLATIEWMEEKLLEFRGAILFITHDRRFLRKLATRIIELDRGKFLAWVGDYESFLDYREQVQAEEARHNELFDKRLAEEERWIRQGIKARRTRNEGRVRALKAMRTERAARIDKQGRASFELESGERSGKLVVELTHIVKQYGDNRIINDLSYTLMRGDRLGLIGPNGVGKSTLIKIMLGDLKPDAGEVKSGTKLQVAYFEQTREHLDENMTLLDSVADGRDFIEINGKKRHIMSYLSDFLFPPERARVPVKALSGGERNRLMLARMFSKECNLLVMDEPTNDLDVETLELLEDLLGQFDGTLILVSHDREFMDNVITQSLAFEGNGDIQPYVGGYQDWLRQRKTVTATQKLPETKTPAKPAETRTEPKPTRKLSYKLQRELDQLPQLIETLENSVAELESQAADADFYQQEHAVVEAHLLQLSSKQAELEQALERWLELEGE